MRSFRSVPPRFLRPLARVDTACFARSVCRPKMVLRPGRKCSVSQHALGSCDAAPSRVGGEVVRECERSRCQLRAALQQRAFGARVVYHAQFRTQSVTKHGLPCSGCLPYAIKSKCSFQNFEFPPIARTLPLDTFKVSASAESYTKCSSVRRSSSKADRIVAIDQTHHCDQTLASTAHKSPRSLHAAVRYFV